MKRARRRRVRSRERPLLSWMAAVILTLGLAGPAGAVSGEDGFEGDPFHGRRLFVEKLCNRCHSVWGHGGTMGPDISQVVAGKRLSRLAGDFWNHTPRMIEEMSEQGYAWPTLERDEMADLLSYLYYLQLFDDPGDPARGATAFARLQCESCHTVGGRGGAGGGPVDRFATYASPLPLAQAMWNAGPAMREAQAGRSTAMPHFVDREMSDIQAYIRERGKHGDPERMQLLPQPDPADGKQIFAAKGCAKCHATGKAGAPDLTMEALHLTGSQIGGILWNHSYAMQDEMRREGIPFPEFRDNELSDLISYLLFSSYGTHVGDPERGEAVFEDKGCATCHEDQRIEAPDILGTRAPVDAISLAAAMWNHAPQMHEVMAEYEVPWPRFEGFDMEDLVAFLRRSISSDR